jgi:hypothetical protein
MTKLSTQTSSTHTSSDIPAEAGVPEERAVQVMEHWVHRAGELARSTAQRVPAAVVIVVGGAALLAADAFGIGEVLTGAVAGYAAYRLLRRRGKKREKARIGTECPTSIETNAVPAGGR